MKELLGLLKRFSASLDKDKLIKERIIEAVSIHTGIILSPDDISLKDGLLAIQASPVRKNEILLREESLKRALSEAKIPFTRIVYK